MLQHLLLGVQALYTLIMPETFGVVVSCTLSVYGELNFGGEVYPELPAASYTTLEVLLGGEVHIMRFDVCACSPRRL